MKTSRLLKSVSGSRYLSGLNTGRLAVSFGESYFLRKLLMPLLVPLKLWASYRIVLLVKSDGECSREGKIWDKPPSHCAAIAFPTSELPFSWGSAQWTNVPEEKHPNCFWSSELIRLEWLGYGEFSVGIFHQIRNYLIGTNVMPMWLYC